MFWNPFKPKPPAAPPIESLTDDELTALVRAHEPTFERALLDAPEALLGWLCAHARAFDRQADVPPALREETGLGRFAGGAEEEAQLRRALQGERTERWSFLGHGEQTFLYWDRSALPGPRVVELDHERRMGDVICHDWRGARQVLLGLWARWAGGRTPSGARERPPGVAERACYCSVHQPPVS